MKKLLSRLGFSLALFVSGQNLFAQTSLYHENFDAADHLASGWYATSSSWDTTAANPDTIVGSTGLGHMVIRNGTGITGSDSLITPSFATTGYRNINMLYAARNTSKFADSGSSVSLHISINNGVWSPLNYTENPNSSAWMWINGGAPIVLPSAADNQSNIRLMWIAHLHSNSKGTYGIDDLNVIGTHNTGINDIEGSFAKIYASNGQISIAQSAADHANVDIYDITGQLVYSNTIGTAAHIPSAKFTQGIYVVRVSTLQQSAISKILIN